jgi:hypothetical protein
MEPRPGEHPDRDHLTYRNEEPCGKYPHPASPW